MERNAIHEERYSDDNLNETGMRKLDNFDNDNVDLDDVGNWLNTASKVTDTYTKVSTAINGGAHPASPAVQQLMAQTPTALPKVQPPSGPTSSSGISTTWIIAGVVGVIVLVVVIYFATRK